MSKKSKIFIPCEEAGHNCDKSQYKEATLWEKIKLNIHLIYCRACREYSNGNGKLTKVMQNQKLDYLNISEKEALKVIFDSELKRLG